MINFKFTLIPKFKKIVNFNDSYGYCNILQLLFMNEMIFLLITVNMLSN